MAARLIMLRLPGSPVPVPDREDDLESFWHVLLWTALRCCEHTMPVNAIVDNLCRLFDHMYVGTTGQAEGGHAKRDLLMAGGLVELELGSIPLDRIFTDTSDVLASRYPRKKKLEADFRTVQDIWDTVQNKNPDFQEGDPRLEDEHYRITKMDKTLLWAHPLWLARRQLAKPQWMETIFQNALDDPQANWDEGGANVERSFPRRVRGLKRKTETEINNEEQPPLKKAPGPNIARGRC